jgi:transposase-like protein
MFGCPRNRVNFKLLLDLKWRGLAMAPELAVAEGALGFWQAIEEVWPKTRGQRCCSPNRRTL